MTSTSKAERDSIYLPKMAEIEGAVASLLAKTAVTLWLPWTYLGRFDGRERDGRADSAYWFEEVAPWIYGFELIGGTEQRFAWWEFKRPVRAITFRLAIHLWEDNVYLTLVECNCFRKTKQEELAQILANELGRPVSIVRNFGPGKAHFLHAPKSGPQADQHWYETVIWPSGVIPDVKRNLRIIAS